jgi:hypothetical protein
MKKTIKSVKTKLINSFSEKELIASVNKLNLQEVAQLNTSDYPTTEEWCQLRDFLVERSLVSNPLLNPENTAYTPAETLLLMKQDVIRDWLDNIDSLRVPESAKIIAFVPCAKTKPWKNATRGLYKSYNKIIKENTDDIYFVTISEPLGIVPQNNWEDFPQYDNPGLFKDVVQRSGGLFTKDWKEHFGKRMKMPWDQKSYDEAINILSEKISLFISNNKTKDRQFISFVGDDKTFGTHADMIKRSGAIKESCQFLKRGAPREEPYEYVNNIIIKMQEDKNTIAFLKNKNKIKSKNIKP